MVQPSPTNQPDPTAMEGAEVPRAARAQSVTALSRDLADFLVEFSIVLHKRSMYPPGHPHIQNSAVRFSNRMGALLEGRESVTLGVARNRLVIGASTTDPKNALLRELSQRLHRHRIASVQLARGATLEEIDAVLTALSADPQRDEGEGPLGKRLDKVGPWEHIRLRAMGFDKFTLNAAGGSEPITEGSAAERDAWVELARLALSTGQDEEPPGDADPLVVAKAIGQKAGEQAYAQVVVGYLTKVAEEMSVRKETGGGDQLSERLSNMIQALDPDTLRGLLENGADQVGRRNFALNASQILAADTVMEVVEAAAKASNQTISHNLLRLLHKLAHHAEDGSPTVRAEADGALRTNVARLIGDWKLDDPNPTRYTAILEGMVRKSPAQSAQSGPSGCEPEITVKMALELGTVGLAVYSAVEALLARREFVGLATLLTTLPHTTATDAIWHYVATPERLDAELGATPMDHEVVAILVRRIGTEAANTLLDRLGTAEDRSTRAAILKQLVELGPDVAPVAMDRMAKAPWFVQRNILVLIGRVGSWPQGFSPMEYATNADPRIRREAIKLLLESPDHLTQGLLLGLRDDDDGIASLAATAAFESCSPEALPLIEGIVGDERRPAELRATALRILARTRAPQVLSMLLALAVTRRLWFGRRVAPKSPLSLAALAGLASHWRSDPDVTEVLSQAQRHSDPEIRAAAAAQAS
jgi:hypothetical protein